jgi:hypothetical protein
MLAILRSGQCPHLDGLLQQEFLIIRENIETILRHSKIQSSPKYSFFFFLCCTCSKRSKGNEKRTHTPSILDWATPVRCSSCERVHVIYHCFQSNGLCCYVFVRQIKEEKLLTQIYTFKLSSD